MSPPTAQPQRLPEPEAAPTAAPLVRYARAALPTAHGTFDVTVYRRGAEEMLAVTAGAFPTDESVFVRVHSECFTGEVLGSLTCDCADQLADALATIGARGHGAVLYLRQEGRGIGLGNRIRAYALQAAGADTIEANQLLGFATDLRDFSVAGEMLRDLGVRRVELHTNNPDKLRAIVAQGIEVVTRLPAHGRVNGHNRRYLETKHRRLGHELGLLLESHAAGRR